MEFFVWRERSLGSRVRSTKRGQVSWLCVLKTFQVCFKTSKALLLALFSTFTAVGKQKDFSMLFWVFYLIPRINIVKFIFEVRLKRKHDSITASVSFLSVYLTHLRQKHTQGLTFFEKTRKQWTILRNIWRKVVFPCALKNLIHF